jgi:hypothetical protein
MLVDCCRGHGHEALIVFLGFRGVAFLFLWRSSFFWRTFLKHCDQQNNASVDLGSYMLVACCCGHGRQTLIVFLGLKEGPFFSCGGVLFLEDFFWSIVISGTMLVLI